MTFLRKGEEQSKRYWKRITKEEVRKLLVSQMHLVSTVQLRIRTLGESEPNSHSNKPRLGECQVQWAIPKPKA